MTVFLEALRRVFFLLNAQWGLAVFYRDGYDEPEILPYAIPLICSIGADI
jgi:hypothetical protein